MFLPKVTKKKELRKIKDIVFKEDIYARFEPSQKLINSYEKNIEAIIKNSVLQISQDNILIDGFHRLKAIERVYGKDKEIECLVHKTSNTDYIELESYAANERHGKKTSPAERDRNIQRLYAKGHSKETIEKWLSVSQSIFYEATQKQRDDEKEERNRKIIKLHLRAWNTQRDIAKKLGIDHKTVLNILGNFSADGKIPQTFKPYIYNIWSLGKKSGNDLDYFGVFPQIFMENLIYYHTEPYDIIYDPFAGSGTTVDVCQKWLRRYYCSDINVIPGREDDIKKRKIQDGIPEDLKKPSLVFLDPPYWKQAKDKYSDSKSDLGNKTLGGFYDVFFQFLELLKRWKINKIAIVIAPTQYPNIGHKFEDHMFKFHEHLSDKYEIKMRYILPYSTEQYNGTQVDIMKEDKKAINLIRELVVWDLKED